MRIEKILESVYVEEFNTTALILEDRIVVCLWKDKYVDRQECFKYIYEYCKGWVQTSERYREADLCGKPTAIASDPLVPYENLYNDLLVYAKENYKKEFKLTIK